MEDTAVGKRGEVGEKKDEKVETKRERRARQDKEGTKVMPCCFKTHRIPREKKNSER